MKVRESGMPEVEYWESLFSINLIIQQMEIDHNIKSIVEVGTGYGTFTLPVSKSISGVLYTYDFEKDCIAFSKNRADKEKCKNIQFLVRDLLEYQTEHKDESIDYVMLFNILHHHEPDVFLKEAFRILRKDGMVGIIHWNYDPTTPRGPSMNIRPKPEFLVKLLVELSFSIKKQINLPPYHYGIIGKK